MFEDFFGLFQSDIFLRVLDTLWSLLPVWLPILLGVVWFEIWIRYKRREYIKDQGSVVLEVKIPREISKSPAAMELFLSNLHQTAVGTLVDVYTKGRVRPWFSLELVSIDGTVHFFIWTNEKFKKLVETQLYAQFPEVEVHEVPDYSLGIYHDPEKLNFGWFGHIILSKADAYPIKTYIDYGLDKDPKEEFKIDPMVAVLEYLGSLKKGEQAWIQIMIQGHTKESLKYGRIFSKPDWKDAAGKEIKELIKKARFKPEGDQQPSSLHLSKDQQDIINAIERSLSKHAFDTMIRATYFAEKEVFDAGNIGGLLGSFKQFSSNTLNGFKPSFKAGYDYPWQDFKGKKKMSEQKDLLEAYKRRSFFNIPFKNFNDKPFILTTEELATLFHFPSGEVAATPTLTRIPSKKSEAPANLPV